MSQRLIAGNVEIPGMSIPILIGIHEAVALSRSVLRAQLKRTSWATHLPWENMPSHDIK